MDRDKIANEMGAVELRGRTARVVGRLLAVLPVPVIDRLLRHREVLKFLLVGGGCFAITVGINYALKLTVLTKKPVTALTIATIVATIVSYVLNRKWSFRTRGGRERRHEAAWFFGISAVAVVVNDVPMWLSRYVFDLEVPHVSRLVQEVSDFATGVVLGTLIAMVFRLWAFRKWAFPHENVRPSRSSVLVQLDAHAAGVPSLRLASSAVAERVEQPAA